MYIDSHCHLQMPEFSDDRDAVVARARDAGVGVILTLATEPSDFHPTLNFGEVYAPVVIPAIAIHPHYAEKQDETAFRMVRQYAREGRIAAIGETGLDFYRNLSSAEAQVRNLERHCVIAAEEGLPIILHCRDAYPALLEVLKKFKGLRVIQHSFSGTRRDMEGLLEAGALLSFSGMVTYPKNAELRLCASQVPEERLLLETDAPYLPPQSWRGKRNEPVHVVEVYRAVADLRGTRLEALSAVVADNFARVIGRGLEPAVGPKAREDLVH